MATAKMNTSDSLSWQDRVIQERDELQSKIAKLNFYLKDRENVAISVIDRELLMKQGYQMEEYLNTLHIRIGRFS